MRAHLPKYNIGVHFLTANTFARKPYFHEPACALIFCEELEAARQKHGFHVLAFVVMPDHVHLLLWWDPDTHPSLTISKIAWAVKGKSARRIVDYLKMLEVSDWLVGDGTAVATLRQCAYSPLGNLSTSLITETGATKYGKRARGMISTSIRRTSFWKR